MHLVWNLAYACPLAGVLVGVPLYAAYLTPGSTPRISSASREPARGTSLLSKTFTGSNPSLNASAKTASGSWSHRISDHETSETPPCQATTTHGLIIPSRIFRPSPRTRTTSQKRWQRRAPQTRWRSSRRCC
ncbi:hypothetical protein BS17DRAFT_780056 [Gyrodon lividus]|nr:hypothetical protein BS17DRAFT_780056 [Gyrodon lividus]